MNRLHSSRLRRQSCNAGFIMVESLAAILVFSFGVIGILALQANSIAVVHDAKSRSDAGLLANRIIGQMWADQATDKNKLSTYRLNDAAATVCSTGTNSSSNGNVEAWLKEIEQAMPLAKSLTQQIKVGANDQVDVTICWRTPQDDPDKPSRRYTTTARIQVN